MFRLFFLTIGVFWCGLEFVMSDDGLDFWVRDPKFEDIRVTEADLRRNFQSTKLTAKETVKEVAKRLNATTVVVANGVTAKATSTAARAAQARGAQTTGAQTKGVKTKVRTTSTNSTKKKEFLRSSTPTRQREAWQRARHNDEDDHTVRLTRMTPLYLMQQSNEPGQVTRFAKTVTETTADEFMTPYNIKKQLEQFTEDFPDVNITFEVIGRTAEYNDIVLMKASDGRNADKYFRAHDSKYIDEVPEKKIVFIVHGLSVKGIRNLPCLFKVEKLKKLLEYYYAHLDKFDVFVIPLANPDGIMVALPFTWNKNASPQSACAGVALDRNFDVAWDTSATISSCSQQYPGPTSFSEPETRAVREVFHNYGHKIIAYIHVHAGSYAPSIFKGDAVLYPKGYSDSQSDDDRYVDLRGEVDEAMKNGSFQVISVAVETLHSWYGKVTGTSVDYASTIYGIPYAFEFVMQLYTNGGSLDTIPNNEKLDISTCALTEIWRRVIDVVFTNIWHNSKNNDV